MHPAAGDHTLLVVGGEGAGGVDHGPGRDLQHRPLETVTHPDPDHPAGPGLGAGDFGPGQGPGPVAHRRPGHGHHEPGVVEHPVAILVATTQARRGEVGDALDRQVRAQPPVPPPVPAPEQLVEGETGPDVGDLPPATEHGEHELLHAHDVGSEPTQQGSLPQGLTHQSEPVLLQIAEPPMDQLRGAARRPHRQVVALQDQDRKTSRHRIEGDADPVDPTPDHHDVECLRACPVDDLLPLVEGGEDHVWHTSSTHSI